MTAPRTPAPEPRDRGAALVLTLFATTMAMIIGTTILTLTVNDLRSARLVRDSAAALDAAEAGVAQISAHLRTVGVASLDCAPDCASGYGSRTDPTRVALDADGTAYDVWLEPLAPLPTHNPGRYRVHSTGYAGDGVRRIEAEVAIGTQPIGLPLALFSRTFDGGGTGAVFQESILTTGCVWKRSHIAVEGTDVAYGIPAGVHSSQYISDDNGNSGSCGATKKVIHKNGACNTDFPHDQDVLGGSLDGTACDDPEHADAYYGTRDVDGNGTTDVDGSYLRDDATLREVFGVPEQPFTDAQLDQLRAVAQAQGNYWTSASYTTPSPATTPHAVLFFDLPAGGNTGQRVDLNMGGWSRTFDAAPGSEGCKDQSLLIVIEGGDAKINANTRIVGNIVMTSPAPYGRMNKLNGGAELIGTIYADSIDLTGTGDVKLDECFVHNLPPSLVDTTLSVTDYREVDRTG